jgi:hypothetical protein
MITREQPKAVDFGVLTMRVGEKAAFLSDAESAYGISLPRIYLTRTATRNPCREDLRGRKGRKGRAREDMLPDTRH